jgi:hypothetical protein
VIRWWRRLRLRRQYGQLVHVIRRVEATQQALGWPRWKKQAFWRDFIYGPRGREALINILKGV